MERFIRKPEILADFGFSNSTLYAKIKFGEFPRPIRLGGEKTRSVGWISSEIEEHKKTLIAKSRPESLNGGNNV